MSLGVENTSMVRDIPESLTRPSKLTRLNDGRGASLSAGTSNMPVSNGSSYVPRSTSLSVPAVPKAEVRHTDQQSSQVCRLTGDSKYLLDRCNLWFQIYKIVIFVFLCSVAAASI